MGDDPDGLLALVLSLPYVRDAKGIGKHSERRDRKPEQVIELHYLRRRRKHVRGAKGRVGTGDGMGWDRGYHALGAWLGERDALG